MVSIFYTAMLLKNVIQCIWCLLLKIGKNPFLYHSNSPKKTIFIRKHIQNTTYALQRHNSKNRNKYSQKRNGAASVLISKFMCLRAIYIFPGSVCLFCCRKICGRILVIYLAQFLFWIYINWIAAAVWPWKHLQKAAFEMYILRMFCLHPIDDR